MDKSANSSMNRRCTLSQRNPVKGTGSWDRIQISEQRFRIVLNFGNEISDDIKWSVCTGSRYLKNTYPVEDEHFLTRIAHIPGTYVFSEDRSNIYVQNARGSCGDIMFYYVSKVGRGKLKLLIKTWWPQGMDKISIKTLSLNVGFSLKLTSKGTWRQVFIYLRPLPS